MPEKRKILVIEYLTSGMILWLFFTHHRYSRIYYINGTGSGLRFRALMASWKPEIRQKITRINYSDFTGSFYDAMEEATQHVNDQLFERYRNNVYVKSALAFCGEDKYSVVMRKELLIKYTDWRTKTYVLLKNICEKEQEEVVFLPEDNEDFISLFSSGTVIPHCYHVPGMIQIINEIREFIEKVIFFIASPAIMAYIIGKFLMRGMILSVPEKKKYRFGFDVQRNGLFNERGFDEESGTFFLYDDKEFHPSRIIHMVRNGHRLSREALDLFAEFSCPWTELDSLKIPVRFFISKLIGSFFLGSLYNLLRFSFVTNWKPIFIRPSFALMNMMLTELLNGEYFDIGVFIARDEYSPFHIVRTFIARRHGNRTAGLQWAEWYYHNTAFSHIVFDKYAVAGNFYESFQKKALENSSTEIIGAAIYGSDTTYRLSRCECVPQKYRRLKDTYTVIGIVSSGYEPESSITYGPAMKFLKDVLEATDPYPHVYRILKPKSTFLNEEMQEMERLHARACIDYDTKIPRFILIPDLIIVHSVSSVFIEGLVAGKKVLSYSFATPRRYNPYSEYHPSLVAFDKEELEHILKKILKEDSYVPEKILGEIRFMHGFAFDGDVAKRFRKMCLELSNTVRGEG